MNEDHVTPITVLSLVLVSRWLTLKSFCADIEGHTARGGVKGIGQKEREKDSKECVVVKTQPDSFKGLGARHVFMVGDDHAEELEKLEQTLFAHDVKRLGQLNKGWIERLSLCS